MASINVRVRVSDLTGGDLDRINRRFEGLGRRINQFAGSRTQSNLNRMRQSVRGLGDELGTLRGRIPENEFQRLNRDFSRLRVVANSIDTSASSQQLGILRQRLSGLNDDIVRLNRRTTIRVRTDERGVRRVIGAFAQMAQSAGRSFSQMHGHAKLVTAAIIAIFVALPGILAAVGALLVPAIAGGFIAIAAMAFRTDTDVRAAFARMKTGVGESIRAAAAPMKTALVAGMDAVGAAVRRMEPLLSEVFAGAAELTVPLANALTDFIQSLLPGFRNALSGSLPVIAGMRDGLEALGQGLSAMITAMTSNKEGLGDVWRALGEGIGQVLAKIGELTAFLIDSGIAVDSLTIIFEGLAAAISLIENAYRILEPVFSGLATSFRVLGDASSALNVILDSLGSALSGDFKGALDNLTDTSRWGGYKAALVEVGGSQDLFGESLTGVAEKAKTGAAAVQELLDKYNALNQSALSSLEAESAMEAQIDKVTEAVNRHTGSLKMKNGELDLSDEKTRALIQPLFDLASKTLGAADAADKNKESWETQRGIIETGRKTLISAAQQMGLTRGEAIALADKILAIPTKRHAKFTADPSGVVKAAAIARAEIAKVKSKTVTITAVYLSGGRAAGAGGTRGGRLATGGVVGGMVGRAATGGVRGNMTLVGEQGPEVVDLPTGSRVRSNPDTRRLLGGGGAGGGTQLIFKSSGRRVDDLLLEILREAIHQRGGDPVAVLGG